MGAAFSLVRACGSRLDTRLNGGCGMPFGSSSKGEGLPLARYARMCVCKRKKKGCAPQPPALYTYATQSTIDANAALDAPEMHSHAVYMHAHLGNSRLQRRGDPPPPSKHTKTKTDSQCGRAARRRLRRGPADQGRDLGLVRAGFGGFGGCVDGKM
jgi:hypothetical protein